MAASASVREHASPPTPRTRLIGRETERSTARTFLLDEAVPLLTLTGSGGVGKTHLALAIARDAAASFADGVLWVDLAPLTDATLVPTTCASALGLSPTAGRSLTEDLTHALRSRQLLLLLDNCEHVLIETAELVGALLARCPALQVLATSRAALWIRGEQVLPVDPLPVPTIGASSLESFAANEAVRLFVARARSVHPTFRLDARNAPTIGALCRELDGLPLAIELAAARITIHSPQALLGHMRDRWQLLSGGPRDLSARQQTMENTIAWSYGLLDPKAQALLPQLSVFAGGFTVAAAQAVATLADGRDGDVISGLRALVDQSLLRREDGPDEEPRFTMLETIRAFGWARLVERGEDHETRRRHAAFCVTLAETTKRQREDRDVDQATWMAGIDAELGNLRVAIGWLLEHGDSVRALQLLFDIYEYIGARPLEVEARRWLEAGLAAAPDAPVPVRAAALYSLVSRAGHLGDSDASMAAAAEGLALVAATHDPFLLGRAYFGLGLAWDWQSELGRSGDAYGQAVAFFRHIDRPEWLALALACFGNRRDTAGDVPGGVAALDEALSIYDRLDDPWGRAIALNMRGRLAAVQGDVSLAVRFYTEAIAAMHPGGDPRVVIRSVLLLVRVALTTNQPERAARWLGAVAAAQAATGIRSVWGEIAATEIVTVTRAALGDDAFAHAWGMGRDMAWADVLAEAVTVLDPDSASPVSSPCASPVDAFALSRREREVLVLMSQRLTDAEIAQRLFLSPRTVHSHVHHILGKLGAANRRDVVAVAVRRGLV